jgi:hypothetical protein
MGRIRLVGPPCQNLIRRAWRRWEYWTNSGRSILRCL